MSNVTDMTHPRKGKPQAGDIVLLAPFLQKPDPAPMSGTDLRTLDSAAVLQRQTAPWTTLSATTGPPPDLITLGGHPVSLFLNEVEQIGSGGKKDIRNYKKDREDLVPRISKNLEINLSA